MKQIAIVRYECSICGAEFDDDEKQKCIEHEIQCKENIKIEAHSLRNMCKRLLETENKCNGCPFYNPTKDKCRINKPAEWNLK